MNLRCSAKPVAESESSGGKSLYGGLSLLSARRGFVLSPDS
jgi:hypothetical protein